MQIDKKGLATSVATATPLVMGIDYMAAYVYNTFPTFKEVMKHPMSVEKYKEDLYHYLIHPVDNMVSALSNETFLSAQPLGFVLIGAMIFMEMWSKRKGRFEEASDYGAHGTSRWALSNEILDKEDITTDLTKEGQLLGQLTKKKTIVQHEQSGLNRNVAVFGGAGSGKTVSYIIPNILNTKDKSIVVTDPKGELYEQTAEAKRKQGYDVRLVNFKDMDISDRYNPLDYIHEQTDALRVAKTIILNSSAEGKQKGDFWDKAEASLLSALILYVKYCTPKNQHHLGSVFNLLLTNYKDMEKLFKALPDGHIAKKAYLQAVDKLEDKVRSNVFISLSVTMDLWKYEKVCRFTQTSDFNMRDLGTKKTIVYLVIPIAEDEFKPLISSFFTQLFTELYSLADENFNRLPVSVRMLMDEFNNIGKIPRFEERLSTCRSYGIEVSMIIQSLGQLRDRWGKDKSDELLDNCDIRLFLGTNALDSAKYFSGLIGKTTIRVQSMSENKGGNGTSSGESYQMSSRDLMTADELLRMDKETAILFVKGKYPMKIQKARYYQMKYFTEMLGGQVSRKEYPMEERGEYTVFQSQLDSALALLEQPSIKEKFTFDETVPLSEIMEEAENKKAQQEKLPVFEPVSEPEEKKKTEEKVTVDSLEL